MPIQDDQVSVGALYCENRVRVGTNYRSPIGLGMCSQCERMFVALPAPFAGEYRGLDRLHLFPRILPGRCATSPSNVRLRASLPFRPYARNCSSRQYRLGSGSGRLWRQASNRHLPRPVRDLRFFQAGVKVVKILSAKPVGRHGHTPQSFVILHKARDEVYIHGLGVAFA